TKLPPKPPVPTMPNVPPKPVLTPGGNPGVMPAPAQTGVMIGGGQTCPQGGKLAHSSDAQSVPGVHRAATLAAPGSLQSPPAQTAGVAQRSEHRSPTVGGSPHCPMPSLCIGWQPRSARQGAIARAPQAAPSSPGLLQTPLNVLHDS